MTSTEVIDSSPITADEVAAAASELLQKTLGDEAALDELRTKNVAVLTTMMPPMLREMVNEAAGVGTDNEIGAAAWVRNLIARELGYTLPAAEEKVKKASNKRSVELKQKAQRSVVNELIARARRGELSL